MTLNRAQPKAVGFFHSFFFFVTDRNHHQHHAKRLYPRRATRHLWRSVSCCTSPWCERLTSVLATFPLCVMFLLCFSLAMRILCLATIFRDDDHKATAEMKPVLGLFSQPLRDVEPRCRVKLAALRQSLTGSPLASPFKKTSEKR